MSKDGDGDDKVVKLIPKGKEPKKKSVRMFVYIEGIPEPKIFKDATPAFDEGMHMMLFYHGEETLAMVPLHRLVMIRYE